MPLSWNEIKTRALAFSREWAGETRETAEAKSFWDAFFNVFGLSRRAVASFEEPVRSIKGTYHRIDLFWKGRLLAEHKSAGRDLTKAKGQAFDYVQDLIREGRHSELPQYIVVTDFSHIQLYDLEAAERLVADFPLKEFHRHIKHFAFIAGYKQHTFAEEPAVNLKAAELMANLCDTLEDAGYPDHQRQIYLVRLLFCLFANDTGIFDSNVFDLLVTDSAPDGKDLGPRLAEFFETLNIPTDRRQSTLDESLASLPYVNGGLFADSLPVAHFNTAMRDALLEASRFDWSRISPAVFGALFQGVMEPRARRQIGAHYTSEANILKVIRPLFLDDLQARLKKAGANRAALERLHDHLASLKFLDPACGCGNFLVIAYRELRKIENALLASLYGTQGIVDIAHLARVDVDQFYGIEIDEWPARIAEVAMWLMDHQMNGDLAEKLGQYFVRLPLKKSPTILNTNALRTNWKELLPPKECSFIMGNPPFVGHQWRSPEQQDDMKIVFADAPKTGKLDYVTCWYRLAAEYIQETDIECAFVSTNSVCQGETVAPLWQMLFEQYGVKINFAHRTFQWESEARGKAHVHVVIIGFSLKNRPKKQLFAYENDRGEPVVITPTRINAYLVDAPDVFIQSRGHNLNAGYPDLSKGSQPTDGGNLILSEDERNSLVEKYPEAKEFIRQYMGADEFINNRKRFCLWLVDAPPAKLRQIPEIMDRIKAVAQFRTKSPTKSVRADARRPTVFTQIRQPQSDYLVIPEVSSERRLYIPIGYNDKSIIASNMVYVLPNATPYLFGILTSGMHMAWMRQVAGRLESRYRYSPAVFHTFVLPQETPSRRAEIERCAQAVLDEREKHRASGATLADLYDPITMPPGLTKAHATLDRAVDRAYRSAPFASERTRVEHLFTLYQSLTTLFPETPKRRMKSKKALP
ncbi:MAG: DNA methyltransferase [Kiritimatiellia bacterium]